MLEKSARTVLISAEPELRRSRCAAWRRAVVYVSVAFFALHLLAFRCRSSQNHHAGDNITAIAAGTGDDRPSWRDWWKWHRQDRSPGDVCPFEIPRPPYPVIFLENRIKFFSYLKDALGAAEDAVVILPTSTRPIRDESDSEFAGWRQSPNVQYLVGGDLRIAGAALTLTRSSTDNGTFDITLYLPAQSQRDAVFTGSFPSKDEFIERLHVSDVRPLSSLAADVNSRKAFTTVPLDFLSKALGEDAIVGLKVSYSEPVKQAFHLSRFVKSESELIFLHHASRLAAWVHRGVQHIIENARSVSEVQLKAEFERLSGVCGGSLQSYPAIVGAGPNSAILHYRTGEDYAIGYKPIKDPSYVLIDAAPEVAGYTSDLTRTYFRHGLHTGRMAEVWGIVHVVQREFIEVHYKEGASWAAINALAMRSLTAELLNAGFLVGELDELIEKRLYSVFMPHGLGHPVGLEVHDPTPTVYVPPKAAVSGGFAPISVYADDHPFSQSSFADYAVPRGHVTTVEPGVYFIPELLEYVRKDLDGSGRGKFVNWTKLDDGRYVELGGVRIEDVVAITHDGIVEVLTV